MILRLFRKSTQKKQAGLLYKRIVEQARRPEFFERFNVPDTLDGRFESLVLHVFLVLHRLKDRGKEAADISQLVFDEFLNDLDAALREAGVGDPSVPKKISKMLKVFYGRVGALEPFLDNGNNSATTMVTDDSLVGVISRNFYPDVADHKSAEKLAAYVLATHARMKEMELSRILDKGPAFGVEDWGEETSMEATVAGKA